jgi:hypothetical protein
MNIKNNPFQRTTLIWGVLIFVGIFGIFAPSAFGMDGFNGGFAISLVSLVFAITAVIVTIMFAQRAKKAQGILNGDNLLAHWRYSREEWEAYTEEQHTADKKDKKTLFLIMVVFFAIGIVFSLILGGDAGPAVALVLFGVLVLLGIVAYFSTWFEYAHNKKFHGEAFVSHEGVILNRELYLWKGWGAKLEGVSMESEKIPLLKFDYSAPSGSTRAFYTLRVPVPAGEEEAARKIAIDVGSL